MAALIRKWKRWMAIGCSHGALVDPDAVRAVLKFRDSFKPERRIHLGDICDYAAFRSGAPGTPDEATLLAPDIAAGAKLIRQFEPTDVLIGNHDERVWRLADHTNAVIAHAASCSRQEFLTACEQSGVRKIVDHYDINRSWIEIGDTKFLHGFGMGGENAIRDMAEHFGKSVVAHFHRAESAGARRSDHAICYCVGTLANVAAMPYAKTRRATARWSHGFTYGEYTDKECRIWLSQAPQGEAKNWRLPL